MLQAPLYRPRSFTDPFGEPPDKIQNDTPNPPTIRLKDHSPNYAAGRQPHPSSYSNTGSSVAGNSKSETLSSSSSNSSISSSASNTSINTSTSSAPSSTSSTPHTSKDTKDSKDSKDSSPPPVGATAGLVIVSGQTGNLGSASAYDQVKIALRDCISKKSSNAKILSVLKQLTYYPPITSSSPLTIASAPPPPPPTQSNSSSSSSPSSSSGSSATSSSSSSNNSLVATNSTSSSSNSSGSNSSSPQSSSSPNTFALSPTLFPATVNDPSSLVDLLLALFSWEDRKIHRFLHYFFPLIDDTHPHLLEESLLIALLAKELSQKVGTSSKETTKGLFARRLKSFRTFVKVAPFDDSYQARVLEIVNNYLKEKEVDKNTKRRMFFRSNANEELPIERILGQVSAFSACRFRSLRTPELPAALAEGLLCSDASGSRNAVYVLYQYALDTPTEIVNVLSPYASNRQSFSKLDTLGRVYFIKLCISIVSPRKHKILLFQTFPHLYPNFKDSSNGTNNNEITLLVPPKSGLVPSSFSSPSIAVLKPKPTPAPLSATPPGTISSSTPPPIASPVTPLSARTKFSPSLDTIDSSSSSEATVLRSSTKISFSSIEKLDPGDNETNGNSQNNFSHDTQDSLFYRTLCWYVNDTSNRVAFEAMTCLGTHIPWSKIISTTILENDKEPISIIQKMINRLKGCLNTPNSTPLLHATCRTIAALAEAYIRDSPDAANYEHILEGLFEGVKQQLVRSRTYVRLQTLKALIWLTPTLNSTNLEFILHSELQFCVLPIFLLDEVICELQSRVMVTPQLSCFALRILYYWFYFLPGRVNISLVYSFWNTLLKLSPSLSSCPPSFPSSSLSSPQFFSPFGAQSGANDAHNYYVQSVHLSHQFIHRKPTICPFTFKQQVLQNIFNILDIQHKPETRGPVFQTRIKLFWFLGENAHLLIEPTARTLPQTPQPPRAESFSVADDDNEDDDDDDDQDAQRIILRPLKGRSNNQNNNSRNQNNNSLTSASWTRYQNYAVSLETQEVSMKSIVLRLENEIRFAPSDCRLVCLEALGKIAVMGNVSLKRHVHYFLSSISNEFVPLSALSSIRNQLEKLIEAHEQWTTQYDAHEEGGRERERVNKELQKQTLQSLFLNNFFVSNPSALRTAPQLLTVIENHMKGITF